ncbi:acyl-CoA dehydrogenase family protein, partial [Zavarzinia sp.]|uniref:acyl-CoA dehydrogenase family protein n=1 Tax=Zavarzinia sp. TaxID=2027920 RepID=UPI003561848A
MSLAAPASDTADIVLPDLFGKAAEAVQAADVLLGHAKAAVFAKVAVNGKVSGAKLEAEQFAAHGLAWLATYVESIRQLLHWAESLKAEGKLSRLETLILQAGFGEYLAQIEGGIAMSQVEVVRPADYGLTEDQLDAFMAVPGVSALLHAGNTGAVRAEIASLIADGLASGFGDMGLDETMAMVRESFRRFAEDKVIPFAHEWHLKDEFIPLSVISELAELGVFGLTLPEEYGGHGLGKTAMCVVTEELSRGYIGVGSLGTRAEIFCELVMAGGTEEQKQKWLPLISSGELLPTAVFTEPNTGSDLGSLRTRAVKDGETYKVTGNKTWITHAARADVMTLLARTNPAEPGYKGLSMFLAEKMRGDDANPFPTPGMTGGEIKVLGYRGMKEYEIGFDGFEVKAENLLGQQEG